MANALSDKERALMDAYWHAANYLSVGHMTIRCSRKPLQRTTSNRGYWGIGGQRQA